LQLWDGPKLNLCGKCTPRESAAVLAGALVFIGHDSGPMHLAAGVGTDCVVIFSARSPRGQWFPLGEGHEVFYRDVSCSGCRLFECVSEGKRCLAGISVEEVAQAVERRLIRIPVGGGGGF
jgi:ADP-heptose:LPS heptosyltransferase